MSRQREERMPGEGNPDGGRSARSEESGPAELWLLRLAESIAAECESPMGLPERVAARCVQLHECLCWPLREADFGFLVSLSAIPANHAGPAVNPLFDFLEEGARHYPAPWPVLQGMITARRGDLSRRALRLTVDLVREGTLVVDDQLVDFLATWAEKEGSTLREPEALILVAELLRGGIQPGSDEGDPILHIYLSDRDWAARSLAARILDVSGEPVSAELGSRLLGSEAYAFLGDYLQYTRAGHLDLIQLLSDTDRTAPALPSLRQAAKICGRALLRDVIAELGWPRLNLGLEVHPVRYVKAGESFPFALTPPEADLLSVRERAHPSVDCYLFVAQGGRPGMKGEDRGAAESVESFKTLNLLHAELLAEILSVSPPTSDTALRIIERMDRIVSLFCSLFGGRTEDCSILQDIYQTLRDRVLAELGSEESPSQIPAEASRLLLTFEDPGSLGEVRTVHGLKRYLHQQGLKLASRLIESGHSTNRTADIVVTSTAHILRRSKTIQFVDFEPEVSSSGDAEAVPYPVTVMIGAFARQLLHGWEDLPELRIFCYGGEVHLYLNFGNHPALLRACFAPPSQGGMVDLQFFGVSKYYLSDHPSPGLDGLRKVLSRLEYDVQIENTHVHARYDKERSLDLRDLCGKFEKLSCVLPYLMDLDWLIGDLDLSEEARERVAGAWADWLDLWGVLPVSRLLTADRRGILVAEETGPTGRREVSWSGEGSYRDRFTRVHAEELQRSWRPRLKRIGMDCLPLLEVAPDRPMGQIPVEEELLLPLRSALSRGEILVQDGKLRPCPLGCYESLHEAELFAEILARQDERLESCAKNARLIGALERSLRFQTTGSINGYEVQRAYLPLVGSTLLVAVLRGRREMARLALFAVDDALYRRRDEPAGSWESSACFDTQVLTTLLRRDGYALPGAGPPPPVTQDDLQGIRTEILAGNPAPLQPPIAGERVIKGLRAAPGRVVGRALFLAPQKSPRDFERAVLLASSLGPKDNEFIYHAGGIVSTGGGVLSHVGLTAMQFQKPALVIPGQWVGGEGRTQAVRYRVPEYRLEESFQHGFRVTVRRDLREPEHHLREGDLVVLDARAGILRVLGQDPETLALDDELRSYVETRQRCRAAADSRDALMFRGRHLRTRYQLEKLICRLTNPALACHMVGELLLAGPEPQHPADQMSIKGLLSLLLGNPQVRNPVRQYLAQTARDLVQRWEVLRERAEGNIPRLVSLHEVLATRLGVVEALESLRGADAALTACGFGPTEHRQVDGTRIDCLTRDRIRQLRQARVAALESQCLDKPVTELRHLLHQVEQIDTVLDVPAVDRHFTEDLHRKLMRRDEATRRRLARRRILNTRDGGLELAPLIGWKAANLAEIEHMHTGADIPPWFAVTHSAFEEVLEQPVMKSGMSPGMATRGSTTLRQAIGEIADRPDLGFRERSAAIRSLWNRVRLPEDLVGELKMAYRTLGEMEAERCTAAGSQIEDPAGPLVSIRSSAREEDAEMAARAGEFDTFLFIRREEPVIEFLKWAWSGLWTERAIHNRAALGLGFGVAGGGVIIQGMVHSRVSGVILTVNPGEGELGEMVINAGLGLGEGVVSGSVAADHIVVSKEGDLVRGPLRFRYVTADKREQVTFNRRAGFGTVRTETLYHQRLRPALEYVELAELVRIASLLEVGYGYPIDMEYAIEGARLWVLQVRPVAPVISSLKQTLELRPLAGPGSPAIHQEISP